MEFNRDFTMEELEIIVKNALSEGYQVRLTEWEDEWEREEGCPSTCYELDNEDIYTEFGDLNIPEETKHGCGEWNFVKGDEYICGYHVESGDEYVCQEAYDAFFYGEFDFKSKREDTPFDITYHAKSEGDKFNVTWEVGGETLSKEYSKVDFQENLRTGKFKIVTE